jgi:sentrin-specific protease 8
MQLVSALPPQMDQYEAIFIPINDGKPQEAYSGTHWSIMVYIRAANSFFYYDTLKFNNLRDGELSSRRIQPLLKLDKPAQFIPSSTPQQINGSDCGGMYI